MVAVVSTRGLKCFVAASHGKGIAAEVREEDVEFRGGANVRLEDYDSMEDLLSCQR